MFTLITKVKWLGAERYREGTVGILKDCSSVEEFEVVEHILKDLRYCGSSDLATGAKNAAIQICDEWRLIPGETLIVGLAEPDRTCGSTAYLRAIETSLPRSWGASVHVTFKSAFRHRDQRANLVLVDDFIGTGDKLADRIDRLKRNPKTATYEIYVIAFAGMRVGVNALSSQVAGRVEVSFLLEKSISNNAPPERVEALTRQMQSLEGKIFQRPGKYSFGYGQSEAAFYLEAANIPNNNFPILWWEKYADDTERPTLFARR